MEGRCQTCRHWDGDDALYNVCAITRPEHDSLVVFTDLPPAFYAAPHRFHTDLVREAVDQVVLLTAADFGCVLFDAKVGAS